MTGDRVLAVAAASGRVGYVVLDDMTASISGLSRKAATGPAEAAACAATWIEQFRPVMVITEKVPASSKKGERTRSIIAAISGVAETADVLNLAVIRAQVHRNKFEEAAALAEAHPELAHLLPKARRPWDSEPKAIIYFEALSLAHSALGGPGLRQLVA